MLNPMATQLAQLLVDSDLEEIEEIAARWSQMAQSDSERGQYEQLGNNLVELKRQLVALPLHPERKDLEVALSMMFDLAAQRKQGG